eukprot:gene2559-2594_t
MSSIRLRIKPQRHPGQAPHRSFIRAKKPDDSGWVSHAPATVTSQTKLKPGGGAPVRVNDIFIRMGFGCSAFALRLIHGFTKLHGRLHQFGGFHLDAHAQMVLPGAVAPSHEGSVQLPTGGSQSPRTVTASKIAGEDAVIGRPLHLNGSHGLIEINKTGDHLSLTKLTLAGNMISRPGDVCQIEVLAGAPAPLVAAGKPNGVLRYENNMPACSFSLDILPGAVVLKSTENICRFVAADCNIRPDGMWGPAPSAINAEQASSDVRALTSAETAVRASFRDLMERQKDRNTIRGLAHEQAAFSSEREEMCRDYAREDQHGALA